MVFVNTKVFVERVARALERGGYRVGVLSVDVPQKKRESLLKRFQAGQLELLVATDGVRSLIHNRAPESQIFVAAERDGLRSMREDGERLVKTGITSRAELLRVTRD